MALYGRPEIFNSDQGAQFTSTAFTGVLEAAGVRISMDGKGRCMDNVFVERLWRSLKYEDIYLRAYATGSEARLGIGRWIAGYNTTRPHQALGCCATIKTGHPATICHTSDGGAVSDGQADVKPEAASGGSPKG